MESANGIFPNSKGERTWIPQGPGRALKIATFEGSGYLG